MSGITESDLVFNVVLTGQVFSYLRPFVSSQMANTDARFRLIANACPVDQLDTIVTFASDHPDRVIDVVDVTPDAAGDPAQMISHGRALDWVLANRDDGEFFCLIDPDIVVMHPFLADFAAEHFGTCSAVTSGRGVWSETDVIPDDHVGVNGEYFFGADGFVFGSPHFALYRRADVDRTIERWGIGFGSTGPELTDGAKAALETAGLRYWLFDTGKLVNAFLQVDGHRVVHAETPALMHIGGMSHYLSPPEVAQAREGNDDYLWASWDPARLEVAHFCAGVLGELCSGRPAPPVPATAEGDVAEKLARVRGVLVDLIATYGAADRESTESGL